MEEGKRKRRKIILIVLLIILLICLSLVSLFYIKNKKGEKNNSDEIVGLADKEVQAIVKAYGEALESYIRTYMDNHNGQIPTYDEVKNNVIFSSHDVKCTKYQVNYDGSIYLAKCDVDGLYYSKSKYGEKKEITADDNKLYLCDNGAGYYYFINKLYDNANIVDTYNCDSSGCQGYSYNKLTTEAIIYDGEYYIYNVSNKSKKYINLGDKKYQTINYVYDKNKTYGLILSTYEIINDESVVTANFYNFDSQKNTNTINEYQSMYSVDLLLSSGYLFANRRRQNNNYSYTDLINFNTGEVIKTFSDVNTFVDNKIGYSAYVSGSDGKVNIYDKDFNFIMEVYDRKYGINSDNTITLIKDKHFEIRNFSNELLYTSKDYGNIVVAVEDYIAVVDDDKNLKIIDLKENEKATLVKLTDNLNVHSYISGWYSENGKDGIYIVVENKDIPYGTEGSGLEYYYIPSTGETGVIKTEGVGGYAKPILYLYPEKKTNIKVSFEKPYLLTTTYPKYKNVWEVTAKPNGDLYDKNGKYYYGLYWEEEGSIDVDFHTGFYVTKDNAIDFLEEKLSYLGLNNRERNEFIMYWLPILEKNEQNLVYFETTSERESYNKLIINPKPDSILRLAIHVKKVNEPITIQEQKLQKFRRKGFTAVEWGGVIH